MPNPYDDLFESDNKKRMNIQPEKPESSDPGLEAEDEFESGGKEPLVEITENISLFNEEARAFAQLLSRTKAVDDKVTNPIERLLFASKDRNPKPTLTEERDYHKLLLKKFETIIIPMRSLAKTHSNVVEQFNRDIDDNYYSVDKTDQDVKSDKSNVIHNINVQRKILGDGTNDLEILKDAVDASHKRTKEFINVGGYNNISSAEYEIIVQSSLNITSGRQHHFDYTIFNINLLDKTAISIGIYIPETSSQYFGKLKKAFTLS